MSDRKDRPARQEADMLERLFEERQRTTGKTKTPTRQRKGRERTNPEAGAAASADKPSP